MRCLNCKADIGNPPKGITFCSFECSDSNYLSSMRNPVRQLSGSMIKRMKDCLIKAYAEQEKGKPMLSKEEKSLIIKSLFNANSMLNIIKTEFEGQVGEKTIRMSNFIQNDIDNALQICMDKFIADDGVE